MSHVKQDTYVNIPSHARSIYNLSGNELIAYGLIHGFSQDEKSWFNGGLQYIADWCGLSNKSRALDVVNRLLSKGCIRKQEIIINNMKACNYQAVIPVAEKDTPLLKEIRGVAEKDTPVAETATNNIDNNIFGTIVEDNSSRIINNTSKNKSSLKEKGKKEIDLSFVGIEYQDMVEKWLNYKRSRREMYTTQSGVETFYSNLINWSNNDPRVAQEIIDTAIGNNYKGICPPKHLHQSYGTGNQTKQQSNPYAWYDCRKLF